MTLPKAITRVRAPLTPPHLNRLGELRDRSFEAQRHRAYHILNLEWGSNERCQRNTFERHRRSAQSRTRLNLIRYKRAFARRNFIKNVGLAGAGIAGLAAAYEMRRAGFDCTVLEARERPGGRMAVRRGERRQCG